MLTVVLILFPFLAALLAAAMPTGKMARNVALGCASAEVGVFLPALLGYAPNVWFKIPWVSALGIDFHVGMDGVSIDRKSTRLNSSHVSQSRMPSSA